VRVSVCLTIHNRSPEVSRQVAESFRLEGNQPDEMVITLDRPTQEARDGARDAYDGLPFPVRFVTIPGAPEWICPARAWNFSFTVATGDLLYCLSSEVVQAPGNIHKAKTLCQEGNLVVFGACKNSTPEQLVTGAEPGVLASAAMPRPLGFISCVPNASMKAIGGCDEGFMPGLWYEDDDLYLRLWRTGLDFLWDDSISGVHLHHERPGLATPDGQAKIAINQVYMLKKHGSPTPWAYLPRTVERKPGRTIWRHP